jgi:hypothetical protein
MWVGCDLIAPDRISAVPAKKEDEKSTSGSKKKNLGMGAAGRDF